MELSSEDNLRMNVLLANKPLAIRIDESSMTLYGLSEKGDAKVQLNPTCRDDLYLRMVREMLSGHVLGSPGGYPVYLQRWSRMGQARDEYLEQLLLLGEPEAVVAVACASGLTDELARRAWWTLQDPDNARHMLRSPLVVEGSMGPELARFLIEYLPFETEPEAIIESLRLALQSGLIDTEMRNKLWARCNRKPTYYLGFLASMPDDLPEPAPPRQFTSANQQVIEQFATRGNRYASMLRKVYTPAGQAFVKTARRVMEKPANQDVVVVLLDVVRDYFARLRPQGDPNLTLQELLAERQNDTGEDATGLGALLQATQGLEAELEALRVLSGLGYGVVRPVLSKTDAIGSLMRRKLEPVLAPIAERLSRLLGEKAG